ncbi:uncharacterized protein LOC129242616 [Anastrepha obliqua]|uniref:uncharacterized protein LOC129242616 n=1 Tax=Anastrepha obliqua TaxID=95512 RepID=UPI0024090132|nr:uncharacterized protein LOC129242616 [Anastrepha obliqua]
MQRFGCQRPLLILALFGFVCLSLAGFVSAVTQINQDSYSSTVVGDVVVFRNKTTWQCDRVFCPIDTEQCVVTKSMSPDSSTVLIRRNICLSSKNDALIDTTFNETVEPNTNVELRLVSTKSGSYVNGGSSSDINIADVNQINEKIQKDVENIIRQSTQNAQLNLRRAQNEARRSMQEAHRDIQKTTEEVLRSLQETHREVQRAQFEAAQSLRNVPFWGWW